MGPRGRAGSRGGGGGFRGRGGGGSRGRGGFGGRGRGRGRGRGGPSRGGRRYTENRLAEEDETESEDGSEEEPSDDGSASEDDEESESEKPGVKPYMSLLQSFQQDESEQRSKRRKIHHEPGRKEAAQHQQQDDSGSEEEVEEQDESMGSGEDSGAGPDGGSDEEEGSDEEGSEKEEADVDQADEAEGVDDNEPELQQEESDDEEDDNDPFETHFVRPDEKAVASRIAAAKKGDWTTKKSLQPAGRATAMFPGDAAVSDLPKPIPSLKDLKLKQKLITYADEKLKWDEFQQNVSPSIFNYQDLLYCDRTVKNSTGLRQMVCLHALNHIFKTRDRIMKNNYKLTKAGDDHDLELRDNGFTRPKVLFLVPTRHSASRMVKTICELAQMDQQENRKRFEDSYISQDQNFGADRPADFKHLFEGNDDDMFRLGVKFTRKTIKFFSQFYGSDILFASPLGLRMAIGSDEEKDKKHAVDYDFLSSIEMVIVDQADAQLMQNWEHVEFIFEHLNRQPKDAHDSDFSRIRSWYLEDWAKYFRQTIVLSGFNTPELSELMRSQCHNWAGKVRIQPEYPGTLQHLGVKAKQTFSRFSCPSVDREPDARFEYFTSAIIPSLVKRAKDTAGTLIFIPSYLDFVRVRNYFHNSPAVETLTYGIVSEYTDVPEASRARSHFLNGRHKILLYTERAHHFRRYTFKGVKRVIFYGLPDNPIFYKEIAGGNLAKSEEDMVIEPGRGTVKVMFSKYDVMKLERVAGSKRVGKMLTERGDTFDFV